MVEDRVSLDMEVIDLKKALIVVLLGLVLLIFADMNGFFTSNQTSFLKTYFETYFQSQVPESHEEVMSTGADLPLSYESLDLVEVQEAPIYDPMDDEIAFNKEINPYEVYGPYIEEQLAIIMAQPMTSSNPSDYIRKNQSVFDQLVELNGSLDKPEVLFYLLFQLELSDLQVDQGYGLREHIILNLCQTMSGYEGQGGYLRPGDWLKDYREAYRIHIDDYAYSGDDETLKVIYDAEKKNNPSTSNTFNVYQIYIHDVMEEESTDGQRLVKVVADVLTFQFEGYDHLLWISDADQYTAAYTYNPEDLSSLVYDRAVGKDREEILRGICKYPVTGSLNNDLYVAIQDYNYSSEAQRGRGELMIENLENYLDGVKLEGMYIRTNPPLRLN